VRRWQWYFVQNRPGSFSEFESRLILRDQKRRVLLSKFGVPLVWAFSRDEVEAVASELGEPR
jgi:hypothetical protein